MKFDERRQYIGDISQLFNVKNYKFEGGKANGVRATDVTNSEGLSFTVLADRCMDISHLSFKGHNLSYISSCNVVSPTFYTYSSTSWHRNFTGGFLTTCGLDNIGVPCTENGQEHTLHGRISNIPANEYSVITKPDSECPFVTISGVMNDSVIFGDKFNLSREITTFYDKNVIIIHDSISNIGYKPQELMLLYHFNLGYPFLSPDCELRIPSDKVIPRNEFAKTNIDNMLFVDEPAITDEMCYYHCFNNENFTTATVGMFNKKLCIGFTMTFDKRLLKRFVQWKNLAKGEYVMGLEPTTNFVEGIVTERQRDIVKTLVPFEIVEHSLYLEFFDEIERFNNKFS